MAGMTLGVDEFSDLVVDKFLRGQFAPDSEARNLKVAAEEIYVLLRKVLDAGARSDDLKAPLKSIRKGLDRCARASPGGERGPAVGRLLALCDELDAMCEARMARGEAAERTAAASLQDLLRYRLVRLVSFDPWDSLPELRLRLVRLMHRLQQRDSVRLLADRRAAGGTPVLRLSRHASFGRGRVHVPSTRSVWQEALEELGRLPGSKLMPLLTLMLEEERRNEAAQASTQAGAPAAVQGGFQSSAPAGAQVSAPTTPEKARAVARGASAPAGPDSAPAGHAPAA